MSRRSRTAAGPVQWLRIAPSLCLSSQVPGAPAHRIDPDDLDEGMPAPGTSMPLADVVERMMVVSSNEATNMVTELVGLGAVDAALADAGALSSTYGCKYSDFAAAAHGATPRPAISRR